MPIAARHVQWVPSITGDSLHVCSLAQQQRDNVGKAVARSDMQSCRTVLAGNVNPRTSSEESDGNIKLVILGGHMKRGPA